MPETTIIVYTDTVALFAPCIRVQLVVQSMDEEARRQLSYQALRRVSEQALAVPMFSDNMNFVHSSKVVVPSDSGGTPHFYLAEWK